MGSIRYTVEPWSTACPMGNLVFKVILCVPGALSRWKTVTPGIWVSMLSMAAVIHISLTRVPSLSDPLPCGEVT